MLMLFLAALCGAGVPELQEVQERAWSRHGVESVAEGLKSDDVAVRRETLRLLGQLRDDVDVHVVPFLDDVELGGAAAEALALSKTPGAASILAAWRAQAPATSDGSISLKLAYLDGFGRRADAGALGLLTAVLSSPDSDDLSAAAALAMGRFGRRQVDGAHRAVEPLVRCVETRSESVTRACAWALARIGLKETETGLMRRLSLRAPDLPGHLGRAWAVRAIATGQAPSAWALADPAIEVRVAALTGPNVPLAVLARHLKSPDPWVADQALLGFATQKPQDVSAHLRPLLNRANAANGAGISAVMVAAKVKPTRRDLADPRGPVRANWISAADPAILASLLPPNLGDVDPVRPATTQDWAALGVAAAVLERAAEVAADPVAPELLLALLENGRPVCRVAAASLATELQRQPELVQLLREGGRETRMAALEGLAKLPAGAERDAVLSRVAAHGSALESKLATATLVSAGVDAPAWTAPVASLVPIRTEPAANLVFHTTRGDIHIALEPDVAPRTVDAVVTMARAGRYANTVTHRVVPAFVAQGGDPTGTGWGGPDWAVPDEDSLRPFDLGAVGMAKSGPDTGGSQWFITTVEQPHLTGDYTRFGHVTQGIDVARALRPGDRLESVDVR